MLTDDIVKELADYPDNRVRIRITNFSEPGSKINPGEVCTFRVRVDNNGHLDMNGLALHIHGKSGVTQVSQTDVFGTPVNFSNVITTGAVNLRAHESWKSRTFYMMALKKTSKAKLLDVHIAAWDASFDSLLRRHTGHDTGSKATLERPIESTND